jgi:nitrilase
LVADEAEEICSGGSVIVSPMGEVLAGPLFGSAGVITAELDLADIIKSKLDFDPIGHYARPDIFDFKVNNQPEIKRE